MRKGWLEGEEEGRRGGERRGEGEERGGKGGEGRRGEGGGKGV